MRVVKRVAPAALFVAAAAVAIGADWFDEDCVCCKPMHENAALMQGMQWETHKIASGLMMVATPPAGMKDDFEACCAEMHEAAQSASAGDPMCGFCQSYGGLMQAGAKAEEVETATGQVTLITSDDPAVVKKIHAHSDRTQAEMDKMAAAAN